MTTRTLAFFTANDGGGNAGLWETDGTLPGTIEIGGIANAGVIGAESTGLDPFAMWTSGRVVYFSGFDTHAGQGLWVSDGSAAGTTEVGGIANFGVADAAHGMTPQGFVGYRGKVVLAAFDGNGGLGLWISDGTAAGTTEIGGLNGAGITGASPSGLNPSFGTSYKGKVYFAGKDSHSGVPGLWSTDGTAAGTTELGGLGNAGISGAFSIGLNPRSIAVANGRLLFYGRDSGTGQGLWVSDGTADGTTEIGGLKNAGVSGAAPIGLAPSSLLSLNGELVFTGANAAGGAGLWISDGTAAGTLEIGGLANQGIADAGPHGLVPQSLVRLGNKALFHGVNAAGDQTLWVTDGTAAGTFELGGVDNAGIAGAGATGIGLSNPAVLNGKVLFTGFDSSGTLALWQSDGTVAGTVELLANQTTLVTGPQAAPVSDDFNGDFTSDMLWRNASGALADWSSNGGAVASSLQPSLNGVAIAPDASWNIAGFADLDGDGDTDVVWRNASGELAAWLMRGATITTGTDISFNGSAVNVGASWNLAASGDFDGDGLGDLLWRNASGELTEWTMNGARIAATADLTFNGAALTPDVSWSVAASGDFNADGMKDLLWRNASGEVTEWQINGSRQRERRRHLQRRRRDGGCHLERRRCR